MKWVTDNFEIQRIFEQCFDMDLRAKNSQKRNEVKNLFVLQLQNQYATDKEKLIRACYLFDNSNGSFSRERFFELCFCESLVDKALLTDLYLTVHTQARPYAYFTEGQMQDIFQNINIPLKCFRVNQELNDLPETIQVYRGLRTQPTNLDSCGYCWTLNKEIAKKFATGDCQVTGFIVSGNIQKDKILGLILVRDEQEIIAFRELIENKKMETISC